VIVFIDNDILLKLSCCDLLNETMAVLRLSAADVRVLRTARFVFQRNRQVADRYSEQGRFRAVAFVKSCQTIVEEGGDEFERLQATDGIDIGEARLLAATSGLANFVLMTGDKRCLQVLAAQAELAEVRQRLQGRVICLEQVILRLIQRSGFDWVKARVVPMMACDTALQACFGSGELATETNVVEALEAYITALRQDAPGLLADMGQF
jgi:hypothetical protein